MLAFRRIIRLSLQYVIYFVVRITPKRRTVVLRGFPSYEDNLISIYLALISRSVTSIVWVVDDLDVSPPFQLEKNTKIVKRGGFFDVYFSITSRFLFITHGHFIRTTPPNQVCVNLWHGIPLKAIGKTLGMDGRSDTFVVATSDFTQPIFAQAFGIDEDKVLVTGQARTDRMLNVDKELVWKRAFPEIPQPKSMLLWLPTFRKTDCCEVAEDGTALDNVFNCSDFCEATFNGFLKKHDLICIVKPHPMATRHKLVDQSNIRYIDEAWLFDRHLSLYELTGSADVLISDVSSIIADFMLLDRPIVLLFQDIDAYESSRGFSLNPITDYLPAKVSRDFESFMAEMDVLISGIDSYSEKRTELKKLFFKYFDGGASKRILDRTLGDSWD